MCLRYLTFLTCTSPFKTPGFLIPAGLMPTEAVLPPRESELPWQKMINSLFFPYSILTLFPEKARSHLYLVDIRMYGTSKDLHPKMKLDWLSHWVGLEAL